jgi:hypothetical protein
MLALGVERWAKDQEGHISDAKVKNRHFYGVFHKNRTGILGVPNVGRAWFRETTIILSHLLRPEYLARGAPTRA